ncbi:MAG: sulfotransferase domain-containing protein [Myxococcota bacterium]
MSPLRDGTKKVMILGATAPLPRAARVALRARGLGALEVAKAKRAQLLLIAHPKSGNTWLKVMISRLYQVRHGLPDSLIHKTDEFTRVVPSVPRLAATNGIYSYEGAVGRLLDPESGDPSMRDKAVLFLARHPCDIAVSWYFQFTKRQSRHKQELINAELAHPIDRTKIEMWDFVRHSDIGLEHLIGFLNGWERKLASHPRATTIRYEDLRGEPEATLRRVTELLGEDFSDEEIGEAVRYGSFDHLKQLEGQGHFKQGGLTLRNSADPESFKVRRAKVGGYVDYFTPEQVAELDEIVAKQLSPTLGYGPLSEVRPLS